MEKMKKVDTLLPYFYNNDVFLSISAIAKLIIRYIIGHVSTCMAGTLPLLVAGSGT